MKVITELKAKHRRAQWTEPRGILHTLHDEPRPGCFRRVTLGAAGVVIRRGEIAVGIPLAVLLHLAELVEPRLRPKSKPALVPVSMAHQIKLRAAQIVKAHQIKLRAAQIVKAERNKARTAQSK